MLNASCLYPNDFKLNIDVLYLSYLFIQKELLPLVLTL